MSARKGKSTKSAPKKPLKGGKGEASRSKESDAELAEVIGAMVDAAKVARENAYAPYSKFAVGAAVLTGGGNIFAGCNVENASFGATVCAERNAVAAMIAAGEKDPILCVVVTASKEPAAPCGLCRQVLAEFSPTIKLILVSETRGGDKVEARALDRIFPDVFKLKS